MIFGFLSSIKPEALIHHFGQQAEIPLAEIPYNQCHQWHNNTAGLMQQSLKFENEIEFQSQKFVVCSWARIDNVNQLTDELPEEYNNLLTQTNGIILATYLHWGEDCCKHLIGDFAFAILDNNTQNLFLGRDHLGVKPLYFYQKDGLFIFASSLAVLQDIPNIDLIKHKQWLAQYLISRSPDWQLTPFKNIYKLPPAHSLSIIDPTLTAKPVRYFSFSDKTDLMLESDEQYVEKYRQVLAEAVSCRTPKNETVASELSGGLDSSSVSAIAARSMNNPCQNLHFFGFADHQLVGEAMAAVSQMTPCCSTHLLTHSPFNYPHMSEQAFWQTCGAPEEHGNGSGHYRVYKECQKLNIAILLSGFGGDEFVTSEAPPALVEFYLKRKWRLFYSRQKGNLLTKPLHTLRWLYLYYKHNNQSITSRRMQRHAGQTWPLYPLKDEVIKQHSLKQRFFNPFKYDSGQITPNGFALNNRWSPAMTARLENCTLSAARYGIEYRWPLLDIRLLNLFLSIPSEQKLGPSLTGRFLHRRAVSNILPSHIAWGPKELLKYNRIKAFFFGKRYEQKIVRPNALKQIKFQHLMPDLMPKVSQDNSVKITPANNTENNADNTEKSPFDLTQMHPDLVELIDRKKWPAFQDAIKHQNFDNTPYNFFMNDYFKLNSWLHFLDTNLKH